MKIYTKIVIDMATDKVLGEESYEYDGPVAEAKNFLSSDLTPSPREGSTDELRLQRVEVEAAEEQLTALRELFLRQTLLEPLVLAERGLRRTEQGGIERIPKEEQPLAARQAQEIVEELQATQLSALRGEQKISPKLEQFLANREKVVRETISRRGGARGVETNPALQRELLGAELAREDARQTQIATGGQNILTALQNVLGRGQQFEGLERQGLSLADLFGRASTIAGTGAGRLQTGRLTEFGISEESRQARELARAQIVSGGFAGLGAGIGAIAGGGGTAKAAPVGTQEAKNQTLLGFIDFA